MRLMARSVELDPVELLGVGTIGQPGQRRFFLRASGHGESVVLSCEKFHIQGLVAKIQQRLGALGLPTPVQKEAAPPPPPAQPGEPEWVIGELGLGYHESREKFVIVAREAPNRQDQAVEELATARFWATAEQVQVFNRQAEGVLAAGRPLCQHCGLPVDPGGHPCPAANGSRPIF